jgi:hypothetical protein
MPRIPGPLIEQHDAQGDKAFSNLPFKQSLRQIVPGGEGSSACWWRLFAQDLGGLTIASPSLEPPTPPRYSKQKHGD